MSNQHSRKGDFHIDITREVAIKICDALGIAFGKRGQPTASDIRVNRAIELATEALLREAIDSGRFKQLVDQVSLTMPR